MPVVTSVLAVSGATGLIVVAARLKARMAGATKTAAMMTSSAAMITRRCQETDEGGPSRLRPHITTAVPRARNGGGIQCSSLASVEGIGRVKPFVGKSYGSSRRAERGSMTFVDRK